MRKIYVFQGSDFSWAVVEDIVDCTVFSTEILPSPVQSTVYYWLVNINIQISKLKSEHCLLLASKYKHSNLQVKMSGMFILLRISDGYIWITGLFVPTCFLNNRRKILYILTKVEVFLNQYFFKFRRPCIMIYSYNKSQQDALFLNFILVKKSTCFRQAYCPSSGVWILYSQQLVFVIQLCWPSASVVRWPF